MSSDKTLIIFDVDGTLVYSEKRDSKTFAQTYRQIYGKAFPTIDWNHFPHVTDTTIFGTAIQDQFGREVEEGEIEAFQDHYIKGLKEKRQQAPSDYKEIPGAMDLMHYLKAHSNYKVAVATGGWQRPAEVKLQHVSIDFSGIPIIGADQRFTREEIIHTAIDRSLNGVSSFQKIVYIGDAVWDVKTTRNLQMDFVGVRWRNDLEVLSQLGAQRVVQDFRDRDYFLAQVAAALPPAMEKVQ